MDFDYDAFEKECDVIREVNALHLAGFEKWLKSNGLTKKTVDEHVANVDFFINDYLCHYDAQDVRQGCYGTGRFLGDWFIRKTSRASCGSIRANAAGLKKFYAFMLEVNVIEPEDYDALCAAIKDGMPEWLDAMKRYDEMLESDDYR